MSQVTQGRPFDGKHLFQIAEDRIQKIDPKTGEVLSTIPAPGNLEAIQASLGGGNALGRSAYRDRKIHQIDPETGENPSDHRF
jgi:glutamine cyclotransferase